MKRLLVIALPMTAPRRARQFSDACDVTAAEMRPARSRSASSSVRSRAMRSLVVTATLLLANPAFAQPAPEPSPPPPSATTPVPTQPGTTTPTPPPPVIVPPPRAEPPPAAPTKHAMSVSYDKGLVIATADHAFQLRTSFRTQVRFESARTATQDKSEISSRFSVPRSRLQVDGNAFGDATRYKLELAFGDLGSFSFVKDVFLEHRLVKPVWLRVGQWKRPFNRQELVSDFGSEFNERANTAAFVGGGRDLGIAIHDNYEKSPEGLEWVLGVFNGFNGGADRPVVTTSCTQNAVSGVITCTTPPPTTVPSDLGPAIVARLGWNVGKVNGYTEADIEGGPFRLALGVSYKIDLANFAAGKEDSKVDNLSHGLEADAMLKVHGFGLELGAYAMKLKSADPQYGAMVQPGIFVVPGHVQIAGRLAVAPIGARKQLEGRAAFNYYWEGHAWKWATDVGLVKLTGEDPTTRLTSKPELQLRTMWQLLL